MDTSALIQAFTPKQILIKTNLLPLIKVDPIKKTWLGDLLAPQIYVYEGDLIIKIDPGAGSAALADQSEVDALDNGWLNFLIILAVLILVIAVIRRVLA